VILAITRFGLVSSVATLLTVNLLFAVPTTLDPSAWHLGTSMFVVGLFVALAALACVIATGGLQKQARPAYE
jgi:hypothetical protein